MGIDCVNDGSHDWSLDSLVALSEEDPHVKVIDFSRNFGHQVAITAGADFAEGDGVIVMDADLQNCRNLVLRMIEQRRAGMKAPRRKRKREGETWFKLFTAKIFYRLVHHRCRDPLGYGGFPTDGSPCGAGHA